MPIKTSNSKSAWSAKDIYDMIFSTYGNAHVNANKARAKEASKYMIPYIPEKEIMLTTGRYNTGKISTNLLDSIYNASQRTGVPLDIALGLAGRESTLGIGRGFKKGKSVSGTDLYSNWQQIQTIPNNKAQMKRWNSLLGRTDLTDEDYDFKSEFLMRAQDSLENTKPLDENPIDNALKFYQTGKYNPGDSRHNQMVEDDAKALMSDPAIQKWLKTKTGTQMKCGGRRKAQLGLDIREGGIAIPIANNMFYMLGRSHKDGGIAIGPNNKNGLEVEGGEVVKVGNKDIKVFSSVPLLRGVSPAQLVIGGANPDTVFKAQEEFKDRNRINDDGTTYEVGGEKIYTPSKSIQRQIQETGKITIGGAPTIGGLRTFGYLRGLTTARKYGAKSSLIFRAGKELIKRGTQKLVDNGKITKEVAQIPRSIYGQFIGAYGQNLPKTIGLINNMEQKRFGGSKQDDTKTAALKHLRNKFTIRGNYNGGMFGGAGAGSVIMTQPEYVTDTITKRYLVPVTQNFNDAFRNARNSGQNEFMFNGKLYNTNLGDNPNNNSAGANRTSTIIIPIEHKEVRRRKKEFGGNMIYEINGNVKNGLMSARPKAEWGKIDRKNKDYKVGPDGLIYKLAADGEWYTDGTKHVTAKEVSDKTNLSKSISKESIKITRDFGKPKRTSITGFGYSDDESKETKQIVSLTYEKNADGKWVPSVKQSTTTTRDGGKPKDFGMTRTGTNHTNGSYKYHPLTGEKIDEISITENGKPKVDTNSKTKTSSIPRGRGTSLSTTTSRGTSKIESPKPTTPKNPNEARYASRVQKGQAQEVTPKTVVNYNENADKNPDKYRYTRAIGFQAGKSSSSTGGGQKSNSDDTQGRWVGQYKTTNVGDWIGLGANVAGSLASYLMTKSAIKNIPEPTKPIMTPAVKLKTKYNIQPQLSEVSESEKMNRATVRRNTQSSNTSLAREQRLMNEARTFKNTLYGQKENIETQLINQDRLNRQSVMKDNIRTYNDYLNRVHASKLTKNQLKVSSINNLISGLTGGVTSILNTIDSRKATNNTLRAIAAANPNVDARLIGGFDYYIDPITKKKYNKNQQYVGTING